MKRFFTFFFISFSLTSLLYGQLLPPNQPEQDACNALQLCGNKFFTPYSYQGTGEKLDLPRTPCGGVEGNSVWLKLVVKESGSIVFSIIPVDTTDDYDFAVLGDADCNKIDPSNVVRCNFNNNLQPNSFYYGGIVGLRDNGSGNFVGVGTYGRPFLNKIDAVAGSAYLIMINNFGASGGPSSGFTIDFSGSSAKFEEGELPTYDSVHIACGGDNTMKVFMNKAIQCGSVAVDGSDFEIMPGNVGVIASAGLNCTSATGYTKELTLSFDSPLPPGLYHLVANKGTDGNTLIDLCGQEQLVGDSIAFTVYDSNVDLGADTTTCVNNPIQLHASIMGHSSGNNIQWTPEAYLSSGSIINPICSPLEDMNYVVMITPIDRPECAIKDTIQITVIKGFSLLTTDTIICLGATVPLRVSGDDRYSYSWEPTNGIINPSVANTMARPDTNMNYIVKASYPGCRDSVDSVSISVESIPSMISYSKDLDSGCVGTAITFTPSIVGSYSSMLWDFGDGSITAVSDRNPITHAYSHEGIMNVNLGLGFIACPPINIRDTITIFPNPVVELNSENGLCLKGKPMFLSNRVNNPDSSYHYLWSTGDTGPIIKVTHPGLYKLTMTSRHNCATTESVDIVKDCFIDIPNAFTPNGDGINDYFFPLGDLAQSPTVFNMQVFDRWGQLLFVTNRIDGRGWDGQWNGRQQPSGVYVYHIMIQFKEKVSELYQGNVTIIR